jgi:hypothetical protein
VTKASDGDTLTSERAGVSGITASYLPPFQQVLALLGITDLDLQSPKVTVSSHGLMCLLQEALADVEVDEAWYNERYPDVYAAILAGNVKSAAVHFRTAGYREGRHPARLAFDPDFYYDQYKDIGSNFDRADAAGLQRHFETRGYFEGRAGVAEHFNEAERWRAGL